MTIPGGKHDAIEDGLEGLQAESARLLEALEQARGERATLQAILDTSVLAITHFLRDGTILMVNATGARNLGGVPSDFAGKNILELLPELAAQTRRRIEQTFDGGAPVAVETQVSLPGGQRWFRSTYCPVSDLDGVPVSVRLVSQDVTELKRMELLLEATEGQLASVLEHAPHIVVLLDPDGVIRFANRVTDGQLAERFIGTHATQHLPPEATQPFLQTLGRVRETAKPELLELDDPSGLSWEVRIAPVMRRGEVSQLVAFAIDITDRKKARERDPELEAQVQHAQKLESLGVLAGGIAHDFNNLLIGILGNAELSLRSATSGPASEHLHGIVSAAEQAAGLCRQILAYAGRGEPALDGVSLSRLADEVVEIVRASMSKRARIVRNDSVDLPLIEGDASQLRQVVMNLLTNASDALCGKDGVITLSCGIVEDAELAIGQGASESACEPCRGIYIEVQDTGCGMHAAIRRRMFDPFFTTKRLGSGLGLAAVLGIVRSHRGVIHVDSEPGRGTTIRVVLPEAPPRVAARAGRLPSTASVRPSTILVVDDEPRVRNVAAKVLEAAGHRALIATDGVEALACYDADPSAIDAVLLDMSMPRMDGPQTLACLRARAPHLPVVLTSGFHPTTDERAHWSKDPATRFIAKPYPVDALLATLQEIIDERTK